MAITQHVCYVATCDVCGTKTDLGYHWEDPETALLDASEDEEWTLTDTGALVCGTSDAHHDRVRGAESPAALRPTGDAMVVCFDDHLTPATT